MKLRAVTVCTAISLSVIASASWAQGAATSDFAMKASVSNTFEVEESKLALQHASDPKVKSFARKMISDHSKAEKKLQTAAKGSGAAVQMMLDAPHQTMADALKTQSGPSFDKAYLADQVQAHNDTVALLTDYERMGDSPKLQAWAKKSLPTVKMHLGMVKAIAAPKSM